MRDPTTDLEINCRAQLSLLEACRANNPGARVVFAASRQQYGRPQFLPVTEEHPLRPVDVNGIDLVAGERYHLLYTQVYGIRDRFAAADQHLRAAHADKHARQGFIPCSCGSRSTARRSRSSATAGSCETSTTSTMRRGVPARR